MKKLLVVLLALACLSAAAFADMAPLKISGSLETGFAVKSSVKGGSGTTLSLYDNDSGNAARLLLGIAWTAADGNWGLNTRLNAEGLGGNGSAAGKTGALIIGADRAVLWGNVFGGMLTLKGGILDEEGFASPWEGWGNQLDGAVGFEFLVKPMDGLVVGYMLPVASSTDVIGGLFLTPATVVDSSPAGALQQGSILASYAMPNMANVALGYQISSYQATAQSNTGIFWGFVDVKAIANVTARVEWKLTDVGASNTSKYSIFEEVGYVMGQIGLDLALWQNLFNVSGAIVQYNFEPSVTYDLGMAKVGVGGDYGNAGGRFWGVVGPDASSATTSVSNYDIVGWVQIPFGANLIKIGGGYAVADTGNSSDTASSVLFVNYRVFF